MEILKLSEIIIRLCLAILFGGIIGMERQQKNRPAGLRTHILVCLGAAIIALIQSAMGAQSIQLVEHNAALASVVKYDQGRLIAQVVSGIGFLGAGTIIVTKQSVTGLTTAASLWASAGLGIAVGMGYYRIAVLGFLAIIFSLSIIKKVIKVPTIKKLEVQFIHRVETKEFISQYFEKRQIEIEDVLFDMQLVNGEKIYKNVYTIDLPKALTYTEVIEELSVYSNVTKIRLVSIAE